MHEFQGEIGKPIFEQLPPSPLKANQEKFALAHAKGDYKEAWANFTDTSKLIRDMDAKPVGYMVHALDVFSFSSKHIGLENLPHVKMIAEPQLEGVVCEIPIDNVVMLRVPDDQVVKGDFVVLGYNNGNIDLIDRSELEKSFRVIP